MQVPSAVCLTHYLTLLCPVNAGKDAFTSDQRKEEIKKQEAEAKRESLFARLKIEPQDSTGKQGEGVDNWKVAKLGGYHSIKVKVEGVTMEVHKKYNIYTRPVVRLVLHTCEIDVVMIRWGQKPGMSVHVACVLSLDSFADGLEYEHEEKEDGSNVLQLKDFGSRSLQSMQGGMSDGGDPYIIAWDSLLEPLVLDVTHEFTYAKVPVPITVLTTQNIPSLNLVPRFLRMVMNQDTWKPSCAQSVAKISDEKEKSFTFKNLLYCEF